MNIIIFFILYTIIYKPRYVNHYKYYKLFSLDIYVLNTCNNF